MSEAERWTKVGERIDSARESAQRKRLDVGGFFDEPKPSPWRWVIHAAFAVMFFACAVSVAARKPDEFTKWGAVALYIGYALDQMVAAAQKRMDKR